MRFSHSLTIVSIIVLSIVASIAGFGQEPIDLFPNSIELSQGYLRIATWNLEHIDLQPEARDLLPGDSPENDFISLINTFAKAMVDLDLDIVVVVEVQPRQNESDRLRQIRDRLNHLHDNNGNHPWLSMQTNISYDDPDNPYGNLQFGLLWKSDEVTVNQNGARLLVELRQPRDEHGHLLRRIQRVPWLVPVHAGELECDLLVIHLKSGASYPQKAEVDTLSGFIRQRLSSNRSRHLILLGDWNIRPDTEQGRERLRQLQIPTPNGRLMRILTVEEIRPTLRGWQTLGTFDALNPISELVPFTHFNKSPTIDNMLDHIALSRSMSEIFDHPILTELTNGEKDLRPGIEIARPLIHEEDYLKLTDHLPVILTLRTRGIGDTEPAEENVVRIVEALPNPNDSETQLEEVKIKNFGTEDISMVGWKIGDSTPNRFWELDKDQFNDPDRIASGEAVIILRKGRNMALNNNGDTIRLIDDQGNVVDIKTYGNAQSGKRFRFE